MRKKLVSKEMPIEQVAEYARELHFGNARGTLEESLGETMLEACYDRRVGGVIRRLNNRKGESDKMDQLIDKIVARIRGENP